MNFYFKHVEFTWNTQNMQKQKISRETTNLTIKDLGIWGVKKVAMLNWLLFSMLFFSFSCHWGYRNVLAFPEKNGVVYRVFFSARSTWIILTFFTVSLPGHWCISVVSQILFARSFHLQCVEAQGTIWCCYLFFYLVSFSLSKVNFKWASSKENAKEKYKETSIRGSHYACTLGYDSEDKENSWTSNLIKNGNKDSNAALSGIFCNK